MRRKMLRAAVCAAVLMWSLAGSADAAETFAIDTAHSKVGFSITHLAISEVDGTFGDFTGQIVWDDADMGKSSISGSIKTTSINTANVKRDDHLRSADFFDVAKFPDIIFQSKKIEKRGADYVVVGTLTIKGVAKDVEIPFKITGKINDPWGNVRMAVKGELTINRKDFGLTWNKTLDTGGFVLGDEVKITLAAEATHPK